MTAGAAMPTAQGDGAWPQAVVIGVSAGAVDALSVILPALPKDYPLPIMVVVHLPPDRKSAMTELFSAKCQVTVREAEDKEPITGATVYFAPPDYHLLVEQAHSLSLSNEEPIHHSRPSIDVLFESAAEAYEMGLVGIVLTGASSDGAHGLKVVHERGGVTIVQNPDEAVSATMPRAAFEACPGAFVMTLDEIASYLLGLRSVR